MKRQAIKALSAVGYDYFTRFSAVRSLDGGVRYFYSSKLGPLPRFGGRRPIVV
jgi:hypothetical protein